jgi:hypothetical protein
MLFSPVIRTMFQNTGVLATGGTITTYGAYKVHTFTSSGTFTLNRPATCYCLMVGAGGGGWVDDDPDDWDSHAYGYAGTAVYHDFALALGAHAINVGAGGASRYKCYPAYNMGWSYGGSTFNDLECFGPYYGVGGNVGALGSYDPGLTTTFYGVSLTNAGRAGLGFICSSGWNGGNGVMILAYLM